MARSLAGRSRRSRRGLTLLELMAVVTLMGIFASIAIARMGRSIFGNFGADADARRVSLALLQAKRRAISTGANHSVVFQSGSGGETLYRVERVNADGSRTLVDGTYTIPMEVTVTPSASEMVFTFEGQALAPYTVTLAGSSRSWQARVVPVGAAISVVKIQ